MLWIFIHTVRLIIDIFFHGMMKIDVISIQNPILVIKCRVIAYLLKKINVLILKVILSECIVYEIHFFLLICKYTQVIIDI